LISQRLVSLKILPVEGLEEGSSNEEQASTSGGSFLYEPSIETVFERLLPRYIEIQVFRALLESSAAEEAARMAAMENATKNCEDLVQRVTLRANKLRQEGITKELMDIVGGVEALRKSG